MLKPFLVSFLWLLLINALAECSLAPVVELADGKVLGSVVNGSNSHLNVFKGIRYGTAKRFALPEPVKPWPSVYNATEWRSACPQPGLGQPPNIEPFFTETMSEDCLMLNLWAPSSPRSDHKPRPVMVWIHGGGYESGTIFTVAYDGQYLASAGDLVVVSVAYRLGAFGFLYAGNSAPGNLGLHDQVLALKWVQANIARFGGDPHQVTIFGESAGSFSVGSLLLSPLATGLFHRAVMQSGGPNSYWGVQPKSEALNLTGSFAARLGCGRKTLNESIDCLRENCTMAQLVNVSHAMANENDHFKPVFGDRLLPISPVQALKTGRLNTGIDLIYGVTSHEGSGFVAPMLGANITFESAKESIKGVGNFLNQQFGDEVVQFYMKRVTNHTDKDQLRTVIGDVFGDFSLICPTILFGEEYARHSPSSHFYSYRLTRGTGQFGCTGWMPVCHAEDVFYLFMPEALSDVQLQEQSADMIRAWTNFATTGHPGRLGLVTWTEAIYPTNTGLTNHLSLDVDHYRMVTHFFRQTCNQFWKPRIFA